MSKAYPSNPLATIPWSLLSFCGRFSRLETYPTFALMSINRLTWLVRLTRTLVFRRSFDWNTPRCRSKAPDTKNVVTSLPPDAVRPYSWCTPVRNGEFCTMGLKLSTPTIVQMPRACEDSRHDESFACREK